MIAQYKIYFQKLNKSLDRLRDFYESQSGENRENMQYIREMQRICQPCLFIAKSLSSAVI